MLQQNVFKVERRSSFGKLDIDPRSSCIYVITGHKSDVYCCSWHPTNDRLLATGSGDATARLAYTPPSTKLPIITRWMEHVPNLQRNCTAVSSVEWNPKGIFLATGCQDGRARIWTTTPQFHTWMIGHEAPISALKWNRSGDILVTVSEDGTAITWDPNSGQMLARFEFHHGPVMDVDWMDGETFATGGRDGVVAIWKLDQKIPFWVGYGHKDEVNSVQWDPSKTYLGSCSDDMTAKIWSLSSQTPLQTLCGHTDKVYAIQFCPIQQPSRTIVATSSFDGTVRIWDALLGNCISLLHHGRGPVYGLCFSPTEKYLASGGEDGRLCIWDYRAGELVWKVECESMVLDVKFNGTGELVAACTANKQAFVLDISYKRS